MKRFWVIKDHNGMGKLIQRMRSFEIVVPLKITIEHFKRKRTLAQNAKMWAMLTDIANQVEWHEHWLTKDDWKNICGASLLKQRTVPNIEGDGFVVLGVQTSKFDTQLESDMIELIYAFGAEHEVEWSEYEEKTE